MGFYIGDVIPLNFIRINNGTLVTGLTVTVRVLNAATGSVLLTSTSLTEITPGVYIYNWTNSLSAYTRCVEIYTVTGVNYVNYFDINNIYEDQSRAQ